MNVNERLPFHDAAAQRVVSLISNKEHVCLLLPEMVLQMMDNPAGITHTRARQNHAGTFMLIYLNRWHPPLPSG